MIRACRGIAPRVAVSAYVVDRAAGGDVVTGEQTSVRDSKEEPL